MSIENSKGQREKLLNLIDSVCERGYSFEFSLDGGTEQVTIHFVKDFEAAGAGHDSGLNDFS